MATYPTPPGGSAAADPGRTLGIVGLVLAITGLLCAPLALGGLVVSILGFLRSKNVGIKNNLALAGIIVSAVLLVLGTILNLTVWPQIIRQYS